MGNSSSTRCLVDGCKSRQMYTYYNGTKSYLSYCKVHACNYTVNKDGCMRRCYSKVVSNNRCQKHLKCLVETCEQKPLIDKDYCSEHTCFVDNCFSPVLIKQEGNKYCYNDRCSCSHDDYSDECNQTPCVHSWCKNSIGFYNKHITCSQHTCQTTLCNRPATQDSSVCSRTQCKIFDKPIELSFKTDKQVDAEYFMKHGSLNVDKKHLTTTENDKNNDSPPSYK